MRRETSQAGRRVLVRPAVFVRSVLRGRKPGDKRNLKPGEADLRNRVREDRFKHAPPEREKENAPESSAAFRGRGLSFRRVP